MDFERYQRQMLVKDFGRAGQEKLAASTALVIGCGAVGSTIANLLVRAGVGRVRLVDRDLVELSNLPRQILFDEEDVRERRPKAIAAARHLRRINSDVQVEPVVANVRRNNILSLMGDADVVLDGTDNFPTRYLINDAALKLGKPWIYSGVLATYGMTATFVLGETGCLRCLFGPLDPEAEVNAPTCATVGVFGPVVGVVASLAAGEALKLLTGLGKRNDHLLHIDLRDLTVEKLPLVANPTCPACHGQYDYLQPGRGYDADDGMEEDEPVDILCGGGTVQIKPMASPGEIDLVQLSAEMSGVVLEVVRPELLRVRMGDMEMTLFPDGRALFHGTEDAALARRWYRRLVQQ